MEFKRNKMYDDLIIKIKNDTSAFNDLDYEQLLLFTNYLQDLNNYLMSEGEKNNE